MAPGFRVETTNRFDRLAHKLQKKHGSFAGQLLTASAILEQDPLNRSGLWKIRKLKPIGRDKGEYRLRLQRFRFLYDVDGTRRLVTLNYCDLRGDQTYR